MSFNNRNLLISLTGLLIMYAVASCTRLPPPISYNTATTEAVVTATTLSAPTPTASSITQSTPKPTRTKMLIPTEVPTRAVLPTVTAIPILSSEIASAEIIQLLTTTDSGCSFPCWWDLSPGESRMFDVQNYLNSFRAVSVGTPIFNNQGGRIWLRFPETSNLYLSTIIEFEGRGDILEWLQVDIRTMHQVSDSESYEISWNDPKLAEITKPYSLSQIFSTYGRPAEVLMFTYQVAMLNQPHPLSMVVFYPEHGFMIEYVGNVEYERTGSNLTLDYCPSLAFPNFWLWSPSEEITLNAVASWIDGYQLSEEWLNAGRFRPIDETTDLTVEELYTLYTTDEDACISTPAAIWPLPGE